MVRSIKKLGYIKLVTDVLILVAVFLLAGKFSGRPFEKVSALMLCVQVFFWYFSSKISNLYDEFRTEKYIGELLLILQNVAVQLLVAGQIFFILNSHEYTRLFVLYYGLLLSLALIVKNYFEKKTLLYYRTHGGNKRYVVFVGYNDITENLISIIYSRPHYGMSVLGVIAKEEQEESPYTYLGDLEKFYSLNHNLQVDDLIVTTDSLNKNMLHELFSFCEAKGVRMKFVPNYNNYYLSRVQFQLFGNYPLITLRSEPLQLDHWRILKRMFDIAFASLVFIFLLSWLFPILAIIIKLDSKGPVFFLQDRWGKNGEKFKCFKFRSMRPESNDVNERNEFNQARQNDPRITKIGAFLRKSNLDELPQFINVMKGDMSIVGPRPHAHEHNVRTKDEVSSYLVRHWVKPGITGWAQVNGYRGETKTLDAMQKRVEFDIWYIENWTFWLDIKIIFMTIYNMLKGEENAY